MSKKSCLLYRRVMFEWPHKSGGLWLLCHDFQVFVARVGANQWVNEKSSYAVYVYFGTVGLTRTAIQQAGIAASVYNEDCGNIAGRSCSDWNDAPTGLLLSGCFAHRAFSHWVGEICWVGFELVMCTFEPYNSVHSSQLAHIPHISLCVCLCW